MGNLLRAQRTSPLILVAVGNMPTKALVQNLKYFEFALPHTPHEDLLPSKRDRQGAKQLL